MSVTRVPAMEKEKCRALLLLDRTFKVVRVENPALRSRERVDRKLVKQPQRKRQRILMRECRSNGECCERRWLARNSPLAPLCPSRSATHRLNAAAAHLAAVAKALAAKG